MVIIREMANRKKSIKLWQAEEDSVLVTLIEKHGFKNWKSVSMNLKKKHKIVRSPKQCRDRWFNNLKNEKNTQPFSQQEIEKLVELYEQFGPQWSKISHLMVNRTENQLKNYMNATVRRNIRKFNKGKLENEKIKVNSLDVLQVPEVKELLLLKKEVSRGWFSDKFLSAQALIALDFIGMCKGTVGLCGSQDLGMIPIMPNFFSYPLFGFYGQMGMDTSSLI